MSFNFGLLFGRITDFRFVRCFSFCWCQPGFHERTFSGQFHCLVSEIQNIPEYMFKLIQSKEIIYIYIYNENIYMNEKEIHHNCLNIRLSVNARVKWFPWNQLVVCTPSPPLPLHLYASGQKGSDAPFWRRRNNCSILRFNTNYQSVRFKATHPPSLVPHTLLLYQLARHSRVVCCESCWRAMTRGDTWRYRWVEWD